MGGAHIYPRCVAPSFSLLATQDKWGRVMDALLLIVAWGAGLMSLFLVADMIASDLVNRRAARTARMLRQNAPPQSIDGFVARMTLVARQQSDAGREAFWREVARLAGRGEPVRTVFPAAAGSD